MIAMQEAVGLHYFDSFEEEEGMPTATIYTYNYLILRTIS